MSNQSKTVNSDEQLPDQPPGDTGVLNRTANHEANHEVNNDYTMGVGRVEALSDGVFGVAVTLLILNIVPPHISSNQPVSMLIDGLLHEWPAYMAYALTFITVGALWISHHQTFKYFGRVDHSLQMLNVLFLMFVTITPFSSALLAEYLQQPDKLGVAVFVYGGTWVVQGITLNLIWSHAVSKGLVKPTVDQDTRQKTRRSLLFGTLMALMSVLVALISPVLSVAIFCVTIAIYVLPVVFLH